MSISYSLSESSESMGITSTGGLLLSDREDSGVSTVLSSWQDMFVSGSSTLAWTESAGSTAGAETLGRMDETPGFSGREGVRTLIVTLLE